MRNLSPRRDDTLPHQIKLFFRRKPGERHLSTMVTCNCKFTVPGAGNEARKYQKGYYEPMGWSSNHEETREIYNNPENHNTSKHPFESTKRK